MKLLLLFVLAVFMREALPAQGLRKGSAAPSSPVAGVPETRAPHSAPDKEAQPLPRGMTADEVRSLPTYVPPVGTHPLPPPNPVRTLAEFEELEGIVIRWAYGTQNLLLSQILDAGQDEGKVWVLVRPSTSDSLNIKSYLASRGIPLANVVFLSVGTNSIWDRDYGPWTVYDTVTDSMGIVDFRYNRPRPLDDVVPVFLAQQWNLPLYQTVQMPDSLVHTGGNFMVDGFGTGFASNLILTENPVHTPARIDSILLRYCGVSRFVRMDTLIYDAIHHIDMHMKLLDEETILVGEYPPGVADHERIESTVARLRTLPTCYGRPYRIVRVPMPPDNLGRYPPQSDYLTYTNSLIVNKTVLVPVYGLPGDSGALEIYRASMPGYRVIGLDCNSIIAQYGAIHCISKEVGVREPIHVAHARILAAADTAQSYRVAARITVNSGVDSAFVYWRADTSRPYTRTLMTEASGELAAYLPRQPSGTTVAYYVEVVARSGRRASKPLVGSRGPYVFRIVPPPSAAGESRGPIRTHLLQNYPNPFNPATHFGFEIGDCGLVSLRVYDLLGREVATLVNEVKRAGSYTVRWDATGLPSGVYFYRLHAGRSIHAGKALMLR